MFPCYNGFANHHKAKEKCMFVSGEPTSPEYFFLLEES
jgi:hypothetical protein